MSRPLKKVLKNIAGLAVHDDLSSVETIDGITLDSREVETGWMFIALQGAQFDGRDYLDAAVNAGATVVAVEAGSKVGSAAGDALIIEIENLASQVSRLAGNFFATPSKKLKLIGITGTNGKTSCCHLIASALHVVKNPAYMLSTIGNGMINDLTASRLTTADAISVQRFCATARQLGAHSLTMEVSSHGLVQGRVAALNFEVAVFTNLTRDHLDYHGDMESYFQAKRQLFLRPELRAVVINADDDYGVRLLQDDAITARKIAYTTATDEQLAERGLADNLRVVRAEEVQYTLKGIRGKLFTPWGSARILTPLIGEFNLGNYLAAAGALGALLGSIDRWIVGLNSVEAAPGRMQTFVRDDRPLVIVDYAHTPDALTKALSALKLHCEGEIWCVFGCGGNRDSGKRPHMGRVAEQLATQLIITDDNPRDEQPESIVADIKAGLNSPESARVIHDRDQAITFAIANAKTGDAVFIGGKGHEDYQEIAGQRRHFSDAQIVVERLEGLAA